VQVAVDRLDDVGGPDRREHVERVLGARELGVDDGPLGDLAELLDEQPRLGDADQAVVRAVQDEEVRRVRGDPGDGAGGLEGVRVVGVALAEDPPGEELVAGPLDRAWTLVSTSSNPGCQAGSLGVSAASAVRCPPAEPPVMAR
jgi:hypothetical protein